MRISAKEIAHILDGTLEGDPEAIITHPGKIDQGGKGALTFLANPKYESYAYSIKTTALLVQRNFQPTQPLAADAIIRVEDVYVAVAKLLAQFKPSHTSVKEISSNASIHHDAKVGQQVSIGAFVVIEAGAEIGEGTILYPQVFVGKNAKIGSYSILYPGVKVYHDCEIGNKCILQANVVVGSDGFGFAPQADGSYMKIPQIGKVIIKDNVEIGANATIDRATMGATIIQEGVKIDNLVMIAHNVEIGSHTVIAAQAGFAGSGKIGNHCRIGGQTGFVGHIEVADGTQVQAQSGVATSIKKTNQAIYGSPAIPYGDYLRSYAIFKKLPELYRKIRGLEKQIEDSESNSK